MLVQVASCVDLLRFKLSIKVETGILAYKFTMNLRLSINIFVQSGIQGMDTKFSTKQTSPDDSRAELVAG